MITFVSVVRAFDMYEKYVRSNHNNICADFVAFDNRSDNLPISVRYNMFLDHYEYSNASWFVFCHEDFELLENIGSILSSLDKGSLYGVVGGARRGFAGFGMQVIYGNMMEISRNSGGEEWLTGKKITKPVEVEAFDCCCLIVHSSLIKMYSLRFDEQLLFDCYVEDFCAAARLNYGIRSYVYPIQCCHHSGSKPSERLYRHLPYLKHKYPRNFFVGTITYFGTPSWQKKLQDKVLKVLFNRQACI